MKEIPEDECISAEIGDFVSVHYKGQILDGLPFDNSYERGQPITFKLGSGQVIEGWDQGIKGMCIGEKRKLTIPYELAYGEEGIGPIPPKSTLIFFTELVDIGGKKKENKVARDEL